jgi:hypothetical protein
LFYFAWGCFRYFGFKPGHQGRAMMPPVIGNGTPVVAG